MRSVPTRQTHTRTHMKSGAEGTWSVFDRAKPDVCRTWFAQQLLMINFNHFKLEFAFLFLTLGCHKKDLLSIFWCQRLFFNLIFFNFFIIKADWHQDVLICTRNECMSNSHWGWPLPGQKGFLPYDDSFNKRLSYIENHIIFVSVCVGVGRHLISLRTFCLLLLSSSSFQYFLPDGADGELII